MASLAVLNAYDQGGLDALPDYDAHFDVGKREFDDAARTLVLPFSQRVDQIIDVDGLPDTPLVRRTSRYEEHRVPAVRCLLRIRHVRAWSAGRSRQDEPGMLNGLEWDEIRSQLTILTVTGPEHVVDVDRLDVEVEITDEVDHEYRVRRGRLLGVETERRWEED